MHAYMHAYLHAYMHVWYDNVLCESNMEHVGTWPNYSMDIRCSLYPWARGRVTNFAGQNEEFKDVPFKRLFLILGIHVVRGLSQIKFLKQETLTNGLLHSIDIFSNNSASHSGEWVKRPPFTIELNFLPLIDISQWRRSNFLSQYNTIQYNV